MKKKIWVGLTATLALLTGVGAACTSALFYASGYVNAALGLTGTSNTPSTGDSVYFKSSYGEMNTANCEKLIEDEKAHCIKTAEEGAVLLRNENNALPLSASERGITFFGNSVKDPVYRTNAGQAAYNGRVGGSLYDSFKNAGFNINETMWYAYQNSGVSRNVSKKTGESSIGEVPVSFYTNEMKNSWKNQFNDVAVVLLTRYAGEGYDLDIVGDADGLPSLKLHQQEKDLLLMIKEQGFKKTVVIINSPFAMDAKWIEDSDYGVDACIAIGATGNYGFIGVANLLTGKADFSGRLSDTWATDSLSSPANQNFGDYKYTNVSGLHSAPYVVYAEGIYVGYKYYETRYMDQVLNRNNAKGNYGCFASGASWDYSKEMAFTFGYGLSYSNFSQTIKSLKWSDHKVVAEVEVTNNGAATYSGKSSSVVQLYAQLPYESGMAEKSAIQLIGYGRTSELATGEKETVTITVDDYDFATYDMAAANGEDTSKKGCYTFDAGKYNFAIGNDAHDALNNILAKQSVTGLFDKNGNSVTGEATKVEVINLDEYDNKTYAKNRTTGELVYNQMDNADLNYYGDDLVTYLTRDDWSTFPASMTGLTATDAMIKDLSGEYYVTDSSIAISDVKYGVDSDIKLVEMREVEYDDPKWDAFIEQLTLANLVGIIGDDRGSVSIPEVGKPQTAVTNGPNGVAGNYANGGTGAPCTLYPDQPTLCNTFDDELVKERGIFYGEDMLYAGYSWIFGPGNNMHRSAYCGRNSEYYSEDPVVAYHMSTIQCVELTNKGIITGCKHFAFNDMETNRHGVSTFLNEQAARQVYLKAFEGALTDGAGLGVMSSFNRVGCIASPSYAPLQNEILRREWGFKGVNITDSAKDASDYFKLRECLTAGTDLFLSDTTRRSELQKAISTNRDGYLFKTAQNCNKHFYYALSRSISMNGLSRDTVIEKTVYWWQPTTITLCSVLGAATLAAFGMALYLTLKKEVA